MIQQELINICSDKIQTIRGLTHIHFEDAVVYYMAIVSVSHADLTCPNFHQAVFDLCT